MMIPLDSKSYPYLAIAQHYGVDYGEVLNFTDRIAEIHNNGKRALLFYDWQREVHDTWHRLQNVI